MELVEKRPAPSAAEESANTEESETQAEREPGERQADEHGRERDREEEQREGLPGIATAGDGVGTLRRDDDPN
jgi:hypothetical protein